MAGDSLDAYFQSLDWKTGPILWVPTHAITHFWPLGTASKREITERRLRFVWRDDWDLAIRPIAEYADASVSFRSVFQIFRDGRAPEESDEYLQKSALIADGGRSVRGNDRDELANWFASLRTLHDTLATRGYRLQSEVGGLPHDEIGIVLDRDGRLIKPEDKFCGTHRFALALLLGIEQIPVRVSAIHPAWARTSRVVRAPLSAPQWTFHDGIELRFPEDPVTKPVGSRVLRRLTNAVRYTTLTAPLPFRGDYSTSHQQKGGAYHAKFIEKRGRALMWTMEKAFLEEVVRERPPRRILDVATGTGRIAGWLKSVVPSASVTGIDISESMLAVARESCPDVEFRVVDLLSELPDLGQFDLITAFRFFPNADDQLRTHAARTIATLLAPGGRLVFNNHRNFWSASYILQRLTGRSAEGATNRELLDLFAGAGLSVVARQSVGVWPQNEDDSYLLPWTWAAKLEELNHSRFARRHALGYDTMFVLEAAQ